MTRLVPKSFLPSLTSSSSSVTSTAMATLLTLLSIALVTLLTPTLLTSSSTSSFLSLLTLSSATRSSLLSSSSSFSLLPLALMTSFPVAQSRIPHHLLVDARGRRKRVIRRIRRLRARRAHEEGSLRLVGGESRAEGNVQVYHSGAWGIVCDDDFDIYDATVVCRQLGFSSARQALKNSHFGIGSRRFWIDNLLCEGDEKRISSCRFDGWGLHDCTLKEAAGVRCNEQMRNRNNTSRSSSRTGQNGRESLSDDDDGGKAEASSSSLSTSSSTSSLTSSSSSSSSKALVSDEALRSLESSTMTSRNSDGDSIIDIMKKLLLARRRQSRRKSDESAATATTTKAVAFSSSSSSSIFTNPLAPISSTRPSSSPGSPPVAASTSVTLATTVATTPSTTSTTTTTTTTKLATEATLDIPLISISGVEEVDGETESSILQPPQPEQPRSGPQPQGSRGISYTNDDGKMEDVVVEDEDDDDENDDAVNEVEKATEDGLEKLDDTSLIKIEEEEEEMKKEELELEEEEGVFLEDMDYKKKKVEERKEGEVVTEKEEKKETTESPTVSPQSSRDPERTTSLRTRVLGSEAATGLQVVEVVVDEAVDTVLTSSTPRDAADAETASNRVPGADVLGGGVSGGADSISPGQTARDGAFNRIVPNKRVGGVGGARVGISAAVDPAKKKVPWVKGEAMKGVRLTNGRHAQEGRVEVLIGGKWGLVCGDGFGMMEVIVICKSLGLGAGGNPVQTTWWGGELDEVVVSGLTCGGKERSLGECRWDEPEHTRCPGKKSIAGVVCANDLPDLMPNGRLLQSHIYLEDRQLWYLQCAMEENCLASDAYLVRQREYNWAYHNRRLLRFTSSIFNNGTQDFRPFIPKHLWQWHMCHMHYHSMEVFTHYDLFEPRSGVKVAEGHKASFCLEDSSCSGNARIRFQCAGYGDQGISPGCEDTYWASIDCQWIDITGVLPGTYIFRVSINPEFKVPERDFDNNALICQLDYNGVSVLARNCRLGPVDSMEWAPRGYTLPNLWHTSRR